MRDLSPDGDAVRAAPRAPKRRRRRPKIFDDEALVDAVLAVGFERLKIESVAARLDTAPSAIYHHVKDRKALVLLAMDHLLRRQTWPAPGPDWRRYLDESSRAVWGMLEAHPGLSLEIAAQSAPSTGLRAHTAAMSAHLVVLGFPDDAAWLAVDLVIDLAFDVAIRSHHITIADGDSDAAGHTSVFLAKLEVVLNGIAVQLAPVRHPRRRTA